MPLQTFLEMDERWWAWKCAHTQAKAKAKATPAPFRFPLSELSSDDLAACAQRRSVFLAAHGHVRAAAAVAGAAAGGAGLLQWRRVTVQLPLPTASSGGMAVAASAIGMAMPANAAAAATPAQEAASHANRLMAALRKDRHRRREEIVLAGASADHVDDGGWFDLLAISLPGADAAVAAAVAQVVCSSRASLLVNMISFDLGASTGMLSLGTSLLDIQRAMHKTTMSMPAADAAAGDAGAAGNAGSHHGVIVLGGESPEDFGMPAIELVLPFPAQLSMPTYTAASAAMSAMQSPIAPAMAAATALPVKSMLRGTRLDAAATGSAAVLEAAAAPSRRASAEARRWRHRQQHLLSPTCQSNTSAAAVPVLLSAGLPLPPAPEPGVPPARALRGPQDTAMLMMTLLSQAASRAGGEERALTAAAKASAAATNAASAPAALILLRAARARRALLAAAFGPFAASLPAFGSGAERPAGKQLLSALLDYHHGRRQRAPTAASALPPAPAATPVVPAAPAEDDKPMAGKRRATAAAAAPKKAQAAEAPAQQAQKRARPTAETAVAAVAASVPSHSSPNVMLLPSTADIAILAKNLSGSRDREGGSGSGGGSGSAAAASRRLSPLAARLLAGPIHR
jgi:hypothetical protein